MLRKWFLVALLFISSPGFSHIRHHRNFRIEGFSVKTDVLSWFYSVLEVGTKSYNASGAVYFNDAYSLNIDLGIVTEEQPGVKKILKRVDTQLRWYLMQDDCSC